MKSPPPPPDRGSSEKGSHLESKCVAAGDGELCDPLILQLKDSGSLRSPGTHVRDTIGALIIRIGLWGIFYYNYKKNSIGNYLRPA